jgi:single-strand DNA-binding protein
MAFLNKVMAIGNLGKEPTIAYTTGGNKCAKFSIAATKRYKTSNGETKENTTWIPLQCWGKMADVCENLLTKGSQVYIEGSYENTSYTTQSGEKKYSTYVNVSILQVLSGFKSQQSRNEQDDFNQDDEDIPF